MNYLMFGGIRDQDIVEIENCLLDLDGVVEGLFVRCQKAGITCRARTHRRSTCVAIAGTALCSSVFTNLVSKNSLLSVWPK